MHSAPWLLDTVCYPDHMARLRDLATARPQTRTIQWASPEQEACFTYGPAPLLASGGFGASKTFGMALKVLYLMDTFPNSRWLIGRTLWSDLQSTTMKTFFKICPPAMYDHGRRADSEKALRLNNGSEVLWAHLDDPDLEHFIKGLEINGFLLDQAEDIQEEIFDKLCSRLGRWDQAQVPQWVLEREALAGRPWHWWAADGITPIPPTFALLTCNPDIEVHWLYRRFHPESDEWRERYSKLGYRMVNMCSLDNRFLPQQNRQELLNKDISFRRRYVEGVWGIPDGQIHVVPPESLIEATPDLLGWFRATCTLHRVLDHGDTAPTACGWFAVDDAGNHYCYREYYKPDTLISDHRRNITEMSEGERYRSNLADPSIFHKTSQKQGQMWSVADEYSDIQGLPADTALRWEPGDNDELSTRNRINEYLRVDPERLHPITKQRGSPRLFFVKKSPSYPWGCDQILKDIRSQRRVKIGTELGKPIFCDERDDTVRDHGYDLTRYFIASRPPITPPSSGLRRAGASSFNAARKRMLKMQSSGAFKSLALRIRRQSIFGGIHVR